MVDGANYKSSGYTATLPAHVQVRKTIDTMATLKDGHDIRSWSATARKELTASSDVDVMNQQGDIIGTAPKLGLVVVSRVFRAHLEAHPDVQQVKVSSPSIDEQAVGVLLAWVKSILRTGGKFGVGVPGSPTQLIKIRHAAHKLGMEQYVRHFQKVYKDGLRTRYPLPDECDLIERLAVGPVDDMVTSVGERLAYLRRRGEFDAASIAALAEFIKTHPMIQKAVLDADLRAAHVRQT
jgi:hypothetical protein